MKQSAPCSILRLRALALLLALFMGALPSVAEVPAVAGVMDALVARCLEGDAAFRDGLQPDAVLGLLTPGQRETLSTAYWTFEVSAPALVSVVRDASQQELPFWLEERGFAKTDLVVKNENYTYEVWQKAFPAGRVGLGINGFALHRSHYFVGVGPAEKGGSVTVTGAVPVYGAPMPFARGAYTYLDWTDLLLEEVPEGAFEGHTLLPTIRGRARETHLVGAFREAAAPSTPAPDLVTLTWSGDARTTMTVQWRTSPATEQGTVLYREAGRAEAPFAEAAATRAVLEDRNLINDRKAHWFTAELAGLAPGTRYEYTVGAGPDGPRSAPAVFETAPDGDAPFTFLWMSDVHNKKDSVPLLETATRLHPDAAFLAISGDLVGMGQYRDDWDALLGNYADFVRRRPLVPSIGNHDAIDGLGSELYSALFRLPDNGPEGMAPGKTYALNYGSLLLLSLDVTADIAPQSAWVDRTLAASDARWKVAMLHFPPYSHEEDYPEIRREWGTLFDRHGVDIVLSGHVHYYQRTFPLRGGEKAGGGPVYLISVGVNGSPHPAPVPPYAEVLNLGGAATCQAFTVDGDTLTMNAYEADGDVQDTFTLRK
ncbi:MAG: metallophosphoesterase family protein [Candidatus Hydrogenedentes bacterium]|nr:metallophosphoesterase family protein [Candidatus Hydrogenedentota bacterium]